MSKDPIFKSLSETTERVADIRPADGHFSLAALVFVVHFFGLTAADGRQDAVRPRSRVPKIQAGGDA
jgi:hypothetical protein